MRPGLICSRSMESTGGGPERSAGCAAATAARPERRIPRETVFRGMSDLLLNAGGAGSSAGAKDPGDRAVGGLGAAGVWAWAVFPGPRAVSAGSDRQRRASRATDPALATYTG